MPSRTVKLRHALALTLILALLVLHPASAASAPQWQVSSAIQKAMQETQVAFFSGDQASAQAALTEAQHTFDTQFEPQARDWAPEAVAVVEDALRQADSALQRHDQSALTAAVGMLQTSLYRVGYVAALAAFDRNELDTAGDWLLLRAYRQTSRFERLNSDAAHALIEAHAGKISVSAARAIVEADLLDTYQSRLQVALHDLRISDARALAAGRAQNAALVEGYFAILAPTYGQQRGDAALAQARRVFADLRAEAVGGREIKNLLPDVDTELRGFRAAPLSADEQSRRAGQLLRFIALVPVEYARGVSGGQVTVPLEIQEAITFRDAAAIAFNDLRSILDTRDPVKSQQVADSFDVLEQLLRSAFDQSQVATIEAVQAGASQVTLLLQQTMPQEWQQHSTGADFDVIGMALDQMEQAAKAGQYDLAESARLEAYAILESGPEAKLVVFAPQMKPLLEDLFWYGQSEHAGLAALIARHASGAEISASRAALDAQLELAAQALSGASDAPVAVASNAAVIVFREGLEAVLILASLLGSMKSGAQHAMRRPLWIGCGLALLATALTWALAQGILAALASHGERLEAVVSLLAIVVLLVITNWFFHDIYWTGWMANFHRQKKRIIVSQVSQTIGLIMLGFTSIYREGFETVLFLQALVLDAGTLPVLIGALAGLLLTLLIGLLVFVVQAKLPHKKMLTFTGVLIGGVLLQMVGHTVHVMQVVGWLPLHPIAGLTSVLPYWIGMWAGLYATWEGVLLQSAAAVFTIGSYFIAEHRHKRELNVALSR